MLRLSVNPRLYALAALTAACATLATVVPASAPAASPKSDSVQLAAFHSRFGGSRYGGGLFGRRPSYGYGSRGYGRRYYSRPSLLHRIARVLAFAYIAHLLFSSGGFSILLWILLIVIFSRLFRRRARRYSY